MRGRLRVGGRPVVCPVTVLVALARAAGTRIVAADLPNFAGVVCSRMFAQDGLQVQDRERTRIKQPIAPGVSGKTEIAGNPVADQIGKNKKRFAVLAQPGVERNVLAALPADLARFAAAQAERLPLVPDISPGVSQDVADFIDGHAAERRIDLERRRVGGQRKHPPGESPVEGQLIDDAMRQRVVADLLPGV